MTPVATPGLGSYAVDRAWRLYWDPAFCASMTVDEGAAVWLHEVGHLLREHADRFAALLEPDDRRARWNAAADAAINADLREAGVQLPPVTAMLPERIAGATRAMSTEQLYRLLAPARGGSTPAPRRPAGPVRLPAPRILLRPGHVSRGAAAAVRLVVQGEGVRFDAGSVVDVLDAAGQPVPGAVQHREPASPTHLVVRLGKLPDGLYQLRVTAGPDTVAALLPVGLPQLDLSPATLPGGFGAPELVAAVTDDLPLDVTSTVQLLDPAPVDGALGPLTVTSSWSGTFAVQRPLADGDYAVLVRTGADEAVAVLSVGGAAGGERAEPDDGDHDAAGDDHAPDHAPDPAPEHGTDCGSGAGGARRPWEAGGAEDGSDGSVGAGRAIRIRQDVARDIAEAARDTRSRGEVPAGWLRWAEAVLHPQVDWRTELNAVVRRAAAHVAGRRDWSYARPSRRASAVPGVVLPAMRAPRPPRCTVVLDTSGSMGDAELATCLTEIDAILSRVRGESVEVIACDASAADAQAVRAVTQLAVTGGGGTDLRVGIAAAAARRPRADLVVVLSDGYTPWPAEPPAQNPRARYVAVLVEAGHAPPPPAWLHTIVIAGTPQRRP